MYQKVSSAAVMIGALRVKFTCVFNHKYMTNKSSYFEKIGSSEIFKNEE